MRFRSWSRRGRHPGGAVLAVAGAVMAVGLAAAPAAAHASLVSSDPAEGAVLAAPPDRILLTFTEPVSLAAEAARLYDADGAEVPAGARAVDEQVTIQPTGELADGTYVLTYRVISADSHPVTGSLSFSVGSPSETVVSPETAAADRGLDLVQGLVQALTYLALLLATGLALFLAWFLPESDFLHETRAQIRRLVLVSAGIAVGGALALVPVAVVYQQRLGLAGFGDRLAWTGWRSADGLLALLVAVTVASPACSRTTSASWTREAPASARPPSTPGSPFSWGWWPRRWC